MIVILPVLHIVISYEHLRASFSLQGRAKMKNFLTLEGLWMRVKELDMCS